MAHRKQQEGNGTRGAPRGVLGILSPAAWVEPFALQTMALQLKLESTKTKTSNRQAWNPQTQLCSSYSKDEACQLARPEAVLMIEETESGGRGKQGGLGGESLAFPDIVD